MVTSCKQRDNKDSRDFPFLLPVKFLLLQVELAKQQGKTPFNAMFVCETIVNLRNQVKTIVIRKYKTLLHLQISLQMLHWFTEDIKNNDHQISILYIY